MKKSNAKVLLGSATMVALGALAPGAQAATDNVSIQAIILAPLSISATQQLNFGSLTETGAGTATIDNASTVTPSGTITAFGTPTSGGFKLVGSAAANVKVTAPASVTITSGANTMTVNAFKINNLPASAATPFTQNLTAATMSNFRVGATLNIGAGQAAGTYTGNVLLTAVYF